jgi:hypothetical protein
MNWLILETQEQLDELNTRMEAVFGNEKPYSLGTPVANGIAVYIHDCVKHMLTTDELSMLTNLPQEVEDETN